MELGTRNRAPKVNFETRLEGQICVQCVFRAAGLAAVMLWGMSGPSTRYCVFMLRGAQDIGKFRVGQINVTRNHLTSDRKIFTVTKRRELRCFCTLLKLSNAYLSNKGKRKIV